MNVVGFNDNQGRPSSDNGWIENEDGRYILWVADRGGTHFNPLTGQNEKDGTSLIDYPNASASCANSPTQADLLFPRIS
jgi:hypothetical protein